MAILIDYKERASWLPIDVKITNPQTHDTKTFTAAFDTGASNCVVSNRVFDVLKLRQRDQAYLDGVSGSVIVILSTIDLELQNNLIFNNLTVSVSALPVGVDMLLGMDIITRGNFHVDTNTSTVLSFCSNIL